MAQRKSWPSHELNPTWVIVGELGKSWPGVFSWDPQHLQKKKENEKNNNLFLPILCLGVELEESVSMESDWPSL